MAIQEDKVYVLNPCYQLRNDIHRVALFSKTSAVCNGSGDWCSFIHPVQAAMLSFFTYNRRLGENLRLLSGFFHRDVERMEEIITSYIHNTEPVYTEWKDQKICFPRNMIVELEKAGKDYRFQELSIDSFPGEKLDLTSRRMFSGPLMVTLMLTNRCLTHCQYCYADTTTQAFRMLPTSRIMELIQEAVQLNVQQVNLMGGEIFLHKDWNVILTELVKHNLAPEYISTKIPFTNELLQELKATGYRNLVQVSLDAVDAALLQRTLKVNSAYRDNILRGLQLLDQSGLDYQVSSVLTSHNCDRRTLTDLFRFLSSLENIRDWRVTPVSNSITIPYSEFAALKPSKEQIESLFDYLEEFILPTAQFPILLNRDILNKKYYTDKGGSNHFKGATCSALNTHMFILPDGKVTICEQLYWNSRFIIGDVNHSGLKEVWNSPQALHLCKLSREDIQEKSRCKHCNSFDQCFGYKNRCWSDIIKAYGENCWDFPDPRCRFAPEMKNDLGY